MPKAQDLDSEFFEPKETSSCLVTQHWIVSGQACLTLKLLWQGQTKK